VIHGRKIYIGDNIHLSAQTTPPPLTVGRESDIRVYVSLTFSTPRYSCSPKITLWDRLKQMSRKNLSIFPPGHSQTQRAGSRLYSHMPKDRGRRTTFASGLNTTPKGIWTSFTTAGLIGMLVIDVPWGVRGDRWTLTNAQNLLDTQ
jgi:hypothetical protein